MTTNKESIRYLREFDDELTAQAAVVQRLLSSHNCQCVLITQQVIVTIPIANSKTKNGVVLMIEKLREDAKTLFRWCRFHE